MSLRWKFIYNFYFIVEVPGTDKNKYYIQLLLNSITNNFFPQIDTPLPRFATVITTPPRKRSPSTTTPPRTPTTTMVTPTLWTTSTRSWQPPPTTSTPTTPGTRLESSEHRRSTETPGSASRQRRTSECSPKVPDLRSWPSRRRWRCLRRRSGNRSRRKIRSRSRGRRGRLSIISTGVLQVNMSSIWNLLVDSGWLLFILSSEHRNFTETQEPCGPSQSSRTWPSKMCSKWRFRESVNAQKLISLWP